VSRPEIGLHKIYQMEHRKNQRYSEEFKLKVVKEVLSGQLSNAEAKQKYSLGGNSDAGLALMIVLHKF
jgi:hypothetical protein